MKLDLFYVCFIYSCISAAYCWTSLDLNGDWTVKDINEEYAEISAKVPGGIYSDLMNNGIISDVFFKNNDVETRWVSKRDWIYSRKFSVDDEILSYDYINIVFDGLDTFANITINDQFIGRTENMFIRYIFNVKSALTVGENTIQVYFESAVNKANELNDEQVKDYPIPPACVPDEYQGECHANLVRKMQASFSWDWGPAFPSVGIWKNVRIEAYNSTVIRDVTINMTSNADTSSWDINVNSYFAGRFAYAQAQLLITLTTETSNVYQNFDLNDLKTDQHGDVYKSALIQIPLSSVNLWWPNGYGSADLYRLNVTFISAFGEIHSKVINVGFRTVELVQDQLDSGLTFYFKVNDVPIYMKGSNLIPVDILPERGQNETTIYYLLKSAQLVHMNMLRVWGGGVYESDKLYEIADQLGIMIWQDFMFACSMYPTSDDFLRNVRNEVNHQVKRLQHHPSVALWAGNNENEAALIQNWYGTFNDLDRYKSDYVKLYVDTVRDETSRLDSTRPYITSSPSNGLESESEGYIAQNPSDVHYGDVHYYNYELDSWNSVIYPISRFSSEFGYQSMPRIETLMSATNDTSDLVLDSEFLNHRQHKEAGYDIIRLMIDDQLDMPERNASNYFETYVYYSQIAQAEAIKRESEYLRSFRSILNDDNEGLNMGALYWQLNDVWVAPTWAGIDFLGNWKMMHYFAGNFFAPVIITGYEKADSTFGVFTVSDLTTNYYNVSVVITVYTYQSLLYVNKEHLTVDILSGTSAEIFTSNIEEYLTQFSYCTSPARETCFIHLSMADSDGGWIGPDNYIFFSPLNKVSLPSPTLTCLVESVDDDPDTFRIFVETDKPSFYVWLDVPVAGRFSENGFLQTSNEKWIWFYAYEPITSNDLQKLITITNYRDKKYL